MKRVSETLGVVRSNVLERRHDARPRRGPQDRFDGVKLQLETEDNRLRLAVSEFDVILDQVRSTFEQHLRQLKLVPLECVSRQSQRH